MAFTPWTGRPGPAVLARGETREHAEQSADASSEAVMAPPCVACGKPVEDKDWDRHRFEEHDLGDPVRPYGKADSRELLVLGADTGALARKVAQWRRLHPGLRLELAADGKDGPGGLLFVRYRVLTMKGEPVR